MRKQSLCVIVLAATMIAGTVQAQSPQSTDNYYSRLQTAEFNFLLPQARPRASRAGFRLMPPDANHSAAASGLNLAAAANPVAGSGTPGRIARWAGARTSADGEPAQTD